MDNSLYAVTILVVGIILGVLLVHVTRETAHSDAITSGTTVSSIALPTAPQTQPPVPTTPQPTSYTLLQRADPTIPGFKTEDDCKATLAEKQKEDPWHQYICEPKYPAD